MIVFASYNTIQERMQDICKDFIVLDYTAYNTGLQKLNLYSPMICFCGTDNKDFDMIYANHIMNHDNDFISFMNIIYQLYSGHNICVLIQPEMMNIVESLSKFIQQRYGYNSQFIEEYDDINFYDESEFSINGLYNFDIDRDRYLNLLNKYHVKIPSNMI